MSRTRSIYSLRSESLFEQPICLDGKVLGILEHNEKDLWDLTGIFDGANNWVPKTINTRKTRV
jgi:hypothetical protein